MFANMAEHAAKSAVITGGTRGIGLAIARSLARENNYRRFVLGYSSNDAAAQEAKSSLERDFDASVYTVKGDITVPETLQSMFGVVEEEMDNSLTAFIHNAGLYLGMTTPVTETMPQNAWDFESAYVYYHKMYPLAFKRGVELAKKCDNLRHIVGITNPGCNMNSPPRVFYEFPGTGKSSMEFLVRVFAKSIGGDVNVNAVSPGGTETEGFQAITDRMGGQEWKDSMRERQLNKRWGRPEEIGDIVAFLCSDTASLITGMTIHADGGVHLCE